MQYLIHAVWMVQNCKLPRTRLLVAAGGQYRDDAPWDPRCSATIGDLKICGANFLSQLSELLTAGGGGGQLVAANMQECKWTLNIFDLVWSLFRIWDLYEICISSYLVRSSRPVCKSSKSPSGLIVMSSLKAASFKNLFVSTIYTTLWKSGDILIAAILLLT